MIPDLLSRSDNNKTFKVITFTHFFPLIFMAKSLSETVKTIKVFPQDWLPILLHRSLNMLSLITSIFCMKPWDSNIPQHKYLTLRYPLEVYLNCCVKLGEICVNQPYGQGGRFGWWPFRIRIRLERLQYSIDGGIVTQKEISYILTTTQCTEVSPDQRYNITTCHYPPDQTSDGWRNLVYGCAVKRVIRP